PVANATITPGPLSHQVHKADPMTLHCSVQVGSAPVTFTWLHNGQEVARGPVLELGDVDVGHSGTYQCVATNQLGQDGHHVFQALSPELALEVTPGSPWVTGAQITQLLVEPPWMPAVLWDRVTLTCQGLGTDSNTTWYKDGQRWESNGLKHFTVKESGTYQCDRPGSGCSPTMRVLNDWVVLQVPARLLLEGDTLTLRCRGWRNRSVTRVQFYHGDEEVSRSLPGTELSLSPLQLHHSGDYHCRGRVYYVQHYSAPVTVTVHGAPLGTSPHLELRHIGDNDSGHYHCRVSNGDSVAESVPLNVTVLGEQDPRAGFDPAHSIPHPTFTGASLICVLTVPVANATITSSPLSHQVHTGDNVTLRCSVQVDSAPVTFTWLHDGKEVARGPVLEFGDIGVGHSGTYQCVATNQLGQYGHRVFRALSPELALEVTSWGHGGSDQLVLQVPPLMLLEGDTVTLRCRVMQDMSVTGVRFYCGDKEVSRSSTRTELSLSPLHLNHSGQYRCQGLVSSGVSQGWQESAPVAVTVHELFTVPVLEGPPEPIEGSPLNLSCLSTPSPLRPTAPLLHLFYKDGQLVGSPQGSPQLLVPSVGVSHSGNYSCQVLSKGGNVRKSSAQLRVTVH
ncbi:hypothetical protein HGM15179_021579, partial [Zosterops borbonicus]